MTDTKYALIVKRLLVNTKHGLVQWEKTEDDSYQASFPAYAIRVGLRQEQDSYGNWCEEPYLAIFDDEGQKIEEISESDSVAVSRGSLKELVEYARRIALGVEKALDQILSHLPVTEFEDDDIPF